MYIVLSFLDSIFKLDYLEIKTTLDMVPIEKNCDGNLDNKNMFKHTVNHGFIHLLVSTIMCIIYIFL